MGNAIRPPLLVLLLGAVAAAQCLPATRRVATASQPVLLRPAGRLPSREPESQFPPAHPGQSALLPSSGSGIVRGRVIDGDGAPMGDVRVRASVRRGESELVIVTVTGANGRYEFRNLPPVRVLIKASRARYAGRSKGREAMRVVTLEDGEVREQVDMVLVRTGVIFGRVFAPDGEPLIGAVVQALAMKRTDIGRQLRFAGSSDTTDDLGAFRLHSLAPGRYYVLVRPPVAEPGREQDPDETRDLAPVFYPGTPHTAMARPLTVGPADEVTADVVVGASTLFAVAGLVLGPEGGAEGGTFVRLRARQPVEADVLPGPLGASTGRDGTFKFERVPPGRYTLVASNARPAPWRRRSSLAGEVDVDVAGDVRPLVVRLTYGSVVRGRVSFSPTPGDIRAVQLYVRPISRSTYDSASFPIAPDGTFELMGVRGVIGFMVAGGHPVASARRGVQGDASLPTGTSGGAATAITPDTGTSSAALPAGSGDPFLADRCWRTRALRVNGRDVTDTGLDVGQDGEISGVELDVACDAPVVTGTVRDEHGRPYAGAMIVALSTDAKTDTEPEGVLRPRGRSIQRGRYRVFGLPPGTWDLVAVADVAAPEMLDDDTPDTVERLRSAATRVNLVESQTLALDLPLVRQ